MAKKNTNSYLPEELVFKLLTFVPVLSLLRFKSVCKTWLSIISNPQFIETHLIESHNKQPSVILKVVEKCIYIVSSEISTLVHEVRSFDVVIDLVCSCNGLVCLVDQDAEFIYLGNPMTKRFKKLPTPKIELDRFYSDEFNLGFGFDDISNDYKILRIVSMISEELDDGTLIVDKQAEMYSANDDSWKEIQVPETIEHFEISRRVCVHIKGSRLLCFEGTHGLLSFDLHDEVFTVYPYPISPASLLQSDQIRKSFVLDFEGSAAMIFQESVNYGPVLSLWTLDGVLGNWSWTKKFNLDDSLKTIRVASLYLGDGLFFALDAREYIFFDYKKKYGKKFLPEASLRRMGLIISMVKYNESLVSLEGFKQLE